MQTPSSLSSEEIEQYLQIAKRRGSARRRRRQFAAELTVLVGAVGISLGWATASSGAVTHAQVAVAARAFTGPALCVGLPGRVVYVARPERLG
jgi:hypothetical protein